MSISKYERHLSLLNAAREKAAQAKGARESLLKRLRTEHGCDSLEQAEAKLARLRAKKAKLEKKMDREIRIMQKKYPDLFK